MPRSFICVASLLVSCLIVATASRGLQGQDSPTHAIPPGPLGQTILLGKELVHSTATHPLSKPYVGGKLHCTSCHLNDGTHPSAASFLGVASAYPAWSPREKRVITLEDRVLNCFMRSCNGIRPPLGSEVSVAITTYLTWLSSGDPIAMNAQKPLGPRAIKPLTIDPSTADRGRGEVLYREKCSDCHGLDGQGDQENPPLWGEHSYNQGAGLAQNLPLASYLKVAMPLDDTRLSDQQSIDLAAFVNSHSRPEFDWKKHLPPPERLGEYNDASR